MMRRGNRKECDGMTTPFRLLCLLPAELAFYGRIWTSLGESEKGARLRRMNRPKIPDDCLGQDRSRRCECCGSDAFVMEIVGTSRTVGRRGQPVAGRNKRIQQGKGNSEMVPRPELRSPRVWARRHSDGRCSKEIKNSNQLTLQVDCYSCSAPSARGPQMRSGQGQRGHAQK